MNAYLKTAILVSCLASALFAKAADAPVKVVYFGGYLASSDQVKCWRDSAQKQLPGGFAVAAYPYPKGAGSGAASAVSGGMASVRAVVDDINSHPGTQYVIAGHSSGAALSNQVARMAKNPKQIHLINLDGFRPEPELQRKVKSSTCWYAKGTGGELSRNAGSMRSCNHSEAYVTSKCKAPWCFHFIVAVKSAPANLQHISSGYDGCVANVDWVPKDLADETTDSK